MESYSCCVYCAKTDIEAMLNTIRVQGVFIDSKQKWMLQLASCMTSGLRLFRGDAEYVGASSIEVREWLAGKRI